MEPLTCGFCDKAFSPKRYSRSVWLFNACERLHRTCFIALGMLMECDFVLTQLLIEWHKVIVQARRRLSFQKAMKVLRLWSFQSALFEADQRWAATALNPVRRCWNIWEREALMPALVDSSASDAWMPLGNASDSSDSSDSNA